MNNVENQVGDQVWVQVRSGSGGSGRGSGLCSGQGSGRGAIQMKQDAIYGDLEDIVLDDIYETYPNIESEDWRERIGMFWEDKLDDTGSSQ
jgi:hypothetical protein